jgi:hypothetical protein
MAEISNGVQGPGRLAARIDILERVPEDEGMVNIGPAALNAAMGVYHVRVSFWLGEHEICGHEILLHDASVKSWTSQVRDLVEERLDRDVIYFPTESPELVSQLRRFDYPSGPHYELLMALDTGVFDTEPVLSGEGPGVFLSPEEDTLVQFIEDLLAEAEAA